MLSEALHCVHTHLPIDCFSLLVNLQNVELCIYVEDVLGIWGVHSTKMAAGDLVLVDPLFCIDNTNTRADVR